MRGVVAVCLVGLLVLAAHPGFAAGPQSKAPHGPVLFHPSPFSGSAFGAAVASLGDLNGDGFGDAAVGDPFDGTGAVFVYLGGEEGFSTAPSWTLRGLVPGEQYGTSIASLGDVTGDGVPDVAVGAPFSRGANDFVLEAGRVYVHSGANLDDAPLLILHGESRLDRLGRRVVGGHDATGDGVPDLLVSAFSRDGTRGWAYLVPGGLAGFLDVGAASVASVHGEDPGDELGEHGLAFLPDANGDGRAEWAVGTPEQGGRDAGRVYLLTGLVKGANASAAASRVFDGEAAGDGFGFALAPTHLPTGEAVLAVGAFRSDAAAPASGRVYLVPPLAPGGLAGAIARSVVDGFDAGTAGAALAVGDFDGDALVDLVVGGPVTQSGSRSPGGIALLLGPLPLRGVLSSVEEGARVLGQVNSGRFGASVALVANPDADHPAGILVGEPRGVSPRAHLLLNKPPVARANAVVVPCTGAATDVTLTGEESTDPNGASDLFRYSWQRVDAALSVPLGEGRTVKVPLPPGEHFVRLTVQDVYLAKHATDSRLVRVVDHMPPAVRIDIPHKGHVYLEDEDVLSLESLGLVNWVTHVGLVTVEATASDDCAEIDRVEFYLEDLRMHVDDEAPFLWEYDPHSFYPGFKHLTAYAFDTQGNVGASCMHAVNSGWASLHHLPIVGEGPPPEWHRTLIPPSLGHLVAGNVYCRTDGVDDLLPPIVHPLPLP